MAHRGDRGLGHAGRPGRRGADASRRGDRRDRHRALGAPRRHRIDPPRSAPASTAGWCAMIRCCATAIGSRSAGRSSSTRRSAPAARRRPGQRRRASGASAERKLTFGRFAVNVANRRQCRVQSPRIHRRQLQLALLAAGLFATAPMAAAQDAFGRSLAETAHGNGEGRRGVGLAFRAGPHGLRARPDRCRLQVRRQHARNRPRLQRPRPLRLPAGHRRSRCRARPGR